MSSDFWAGYVEYGNEWLPMKLSRLIAGLETTDTSGPLTVDIAGIAYHSGQVKPGYLFVALKGSNQNGNAFIPEALSRGARALISEDAVCCDAPATCVRVLNSRSALALVAARFFGDPSLHTTIIGVTGTNGKTTTTYILESMMHQAGYAPAVIGTINYRFGTTMAKSAHTTPESLELQGLLATMREGGVTHVAMEVSSHALDQDRVRGVHFDVAVFTNLTADHLDYHKTIEQYGKSKEKLFSCFLEQRSGGKQTYAVINIDDLFGRHLETVTSARKLRYGFSALVDITIERPSISLEGISGCLKTPRGDVDFHTSLVGRYNLYNIMAAAGAALCLDVPLEAICAGLEHLAQVPGRMERVREGIDFTVLVDYAHTPDALEKTLASVQELSPKRIITVFGCGGDRDRSKRPVMGRIAGLMSDVVIITSDNPRREHPEQIINEILKGLSDTDIAPIGSAAGGQKKGYLVMADRREAIATALNMAREGEAVVIAGKGHEDYQIIGNQVLPFDDRNVVRELLGAR